MQEDRRAGAPTVLKLLKGTHEARDRLWHRPRTRTPKDLLTMHVFEALTIVQVMGLMILYSLQLGVSTFLAILDSNTASKRHIRKPSMVTCEMIRAFPVLLP